MTHLYSPAPVLPTDTIFTHVSVREKVVHVRSSAGARKHQVAHLITKVSRPSACLHFSQLFTPGNMNTGFDQTMRRGQPPGEVVGVRPLVRKGITTPAPGNSALFHGEENISSVRQRNQPPLHASTRLDRRAPQLLKAHTSHILPGPS